MAENKENWMNKGGNIALVFKKLRIFSAFFAISEPFFALIMPVGLSEFT
ncbi:MAG: hypothetical protein HN658_04795 [Rhodospirillales bacterium]|nr:hypothetical protein [Rhodospirillales bacterium]MBT4005810.1 hypothetical protein [Rhodospirillales bacterium]MBT5075623.1 hypothetical protein [Rhodospirillales bacterium]MBT5114095.1 hypothetical protein [Rhodospirillales bacterium]MBT5672623.1 hypothetical protein [Rhodospirillales bacterium]